MPSGTSRPYYSMKFFYVYVLKSIKHDFIYVGFSDKIKLRLTQHNKKLVRSTKFYAPLELIHYEAYRNIKDAKRREKYLKTTKGKTTLRSMLLEFLSKSADEVPSGKKS